MNGSGKSSSNGDNGGKDNAMVVATCSWYGRAIGIGDACYVADEI